MAAQKDKDNVWGLGSAGKYRDREGQSCFSMPDITSMHSFGWNRTGGFFFIRGFYGIGGTHYDRLPMPVELAERFLLRCLEQPFHERFLARAIYSEVAEEVVELNDMRLRVRRGTAVLNSRGMRYISMPNLSLSLAGPDGKDSSISLFSELRTSFGNAIKQHSAAAVRVGLRRELPKRKKKRPPAKRKTATRRRRA